MDENLSEVRYPVRIQRRRTKGWRMPPDSVIVSRPAKYGNPHIVGRCTICQLDHAQEEAVRMYALDLSDGRLGYTADDLQQEFEGVKYVVCWCSEDEACHGDVIVMAVSGQGWVE